MEIYSLEVKAGEEYTILEEKICKGWTLEKIRSYIRELKFFAMANGILRMKRKRKQERS